VAMRRPLMCRHGRETSTFPTSPFGSAARSAAHVAAAASCPSIETGERAATEPDVRVSAHPAATALQTRRRR
jgi:hypothetical protein